MCGLVLDMRVRLMYFVCVCVCVFVCVCYKQVTKAKYKGRTVAVKEWRFEHFTKHVIALWCKEALISSNFKHENVVHLIGICIEPPSIKIIMNWCKHGSLRRMLVSRRPLPWNLRYTFLEGLLALFFQAFLFFCLYFLYFFVFLFCFCFVCFILLFDVCYKMLSGLTCVCVCLQGKDTTECQVVCVKKIKPRHLKKNLKKIKNKIK